MAVAAEFPDIDTLWSFRGPIEGFQHHRGITHTFVGVPFEAAFLVLLFFGLHRWRAVRQQKRQSQKEFPGKSLTKAPVRWGFLYIFCLLALLSHLLLDWTNNYGLRPLFPFRPTWHAASIVFIFDPLLFLFLVAGLVLPLLFGLVGKEVGAQKPLFSGAGWARFTLVLISLSWLLRYMEHDKALTLASGETLRAPAKSGVTGAPSVADAAEAGTQAGTAFQAGTATLEKHPLLRAGRSVASPDPFSPFKWHLVTDFGPAYRLAEVDTLRSTLTPGQVFNKPQSTPVLQTALKSRLGRIYMDWSAMPWSVTEGDLTFPSILQSSRNVIVRFEDLRFVGDLSFLQHEGDPPLTGVVVLDASGRVIAEGMDGRFER